MSESWFKMSVSNDAAEITIYDEIGFFGVSAESFIKELKALGSRDVTIRINSPGGVVHEGMAIYTALKKHTGKVTAYIDSLAASMATIIALAADEVIMSEYGWFMIHNPYGVAMGDANAIRNRANKLEKMQGQMIGIYEKNSDLGEEEIGDAMHAETWYTAQEALDAGFIDSIDEDAEFEALAFDLSAFKNPPEFQAMASAKKPDVKAWLKDSEPSTGTAPIAEKSVPETSKTEKEDEMPKKVEQVEEPVCEKAVAQAERARVTAIMGVAKNFDLGDEFANELIEGSATIEQANEKALEILAERQEEELKTAPRAHVVNDGRKERAEAIENAIAHRAGLNVELSEHGRQYRGMSLSEISRILVDEKGLTKNQIAEKALHTTSDLPQIVSNVANKSLQAGYETAGRTFTAFARKTTASDFKEKHSIQMGADFDLEKVNEHGEYKEGAVKDTGEKYAISTFGKIISITRKTIINDDIDALARVPMLLGERAGELENKLVYDLLTSNPTMSDNKALFHNDHGNLGTAKLSAAGLAEGRKKLRTLKFLKQRTPVTPQTLLIPAELEFLSDQLMTSISATKTDDVNPFGPGGRTSLNVVVESLLDAASLAEWYLFGQNSQSPIEYSYLDGNETPTISNEVGFDVDGIRMKISHDFGTGAVNTRAFKSAGTAS